MINAKDFKTHLDLMISEVEEKTDRWSLQSRQLLNNLVAARRICERIITDQSILDKQGKEYFESKMPSEKKPVKIQSTCYPDERVSSIEAEQHVWILNKMSSRKNCKFDTKTRVCECGVKGIDEFAIHCNK